MRASLFPVVFRLSAIAVFGALSLSAAHAQTKSTGLALSNDKPIQIESDQLEIREQERKAQFDGNVKVVQGKMTLQSSHMTVYYKGKTGAISDGGAAIDRIEVSGAVKLTSDTQKATADSGSFNMATEVLLLKGKQVVLSEAGNVFTGCQLTVQMKTGQAKLDSCGGRVKILLDPKSRKNN